MIKKLRHRFITISILSILLVMIVILSIGNFIIYKNINDRADTLLHILAENGGYFPKKNRAERDNPQIKLGEMYIKNNNHLEKEKQKKQIFELSPEEPYENRFFSVIFDNKGDIKSVNIDFISAISNEQAEKMSKNIYLNGKHSAYTANYKYVFSDYDDGKIIVFLDMRRDLSTIKIFLTVSFFIIILSMLTVFIIVYFFSKIVVKPIEESYNKQKRFITDASHEIKTPLAIIDANTDIIEMLHGESEWTKSNKNQIKRLTNLTNSLVSLAKMEENNSDLSMLEFSLSDAVLEEAEQYMAIVNIKEKKLNINIEENITYYGNEQSIRQMINIFLENAIKYSDENGIIDLTLKTQGRKKEIVIKNTVEHIQAGNYDVLFERFYRMDSSRNSETGGYGIGLSLAKSIITLHKGNVKAVANDEKSIEFKIVL